MSIVIDSITYNVPIKTLNRKADALDKFAERTEDGVLHREPIGVFYNYDVVMGMSANNVSDYAALFLKLTEAVESHTITLLGSTFTAYIANVKDEAVKDDGVNRYYRNLSFSVIAISPTITP